MTFFEQLQSNAQPHWDRYIQHDFVKQLGAGTLADAAFKHYLKQDYLFLIQFTRVWGLAVYKSKNFAEMRSAQASINALLDDEISLHIAYCQKWGVSETDLLNTPESAACVAYTRYVLDAAMAGDILALHCAVSPCMVGYAEVGKWLSEQSFTVREGNPYDDWISTYAGEDFQAGAQDEIALINSLGSELSPAHIEHYQRIFTTATRMEVAFWQMGLDLS